MIDTMGRRSFCIASLAGAAAPRMAWSQGDPGLEIGVLPNLSARILLAQYQPMREYLARAMNRAVYVSTAPNWTAFYERTRSLAYDLIVTAPNLARVAQLDSGFVPLLAYAPTMKGLLVYASARPITGPTDLRGQTLALSNPRSLVTMRGMQWLAEHGLQRGKDFDIARIATDDSVGSVVVRGEAIAAMLSNGEFRAIPDAIKALLQPLTSFAEVPGFVVLASPKLRTDEVRAVKQHLLEFANGSEDGRIFFANTGLSGMHEPSASLMASMDPYLQATRQAMAAAAP